jgi:hypothetical protein
MPNLFQRKDAEDPEICLFHVLLRGQHVKKDLFPPGKTVKLDFCVTHFCIVLQGLKALASRNRPHFLLYSNTIPFCLPLRGRKAKNLSLRSL